MHSNIHTNQSGVDHHKGVNRDEKSNSSSSGATSNESSSPHTNTDHNGIKKKKSKKVACVSCHKAHARCDRSCNEQRSCSRCVKLGIQCIEQIKKKTTREERLRTLQEHRKNSLNMKILPRTTCNNSTSNTTNQSTCSSSTNTSPHTRISPSTPSQLYSGYNPFNNVSSPSLSSVCSQSSTSSTNSEMSSHNSTSSNSSQSTVNSGYLMKPSGLNNSQLISFSQTIPTSQNSYPNCSPQTTFTKVSGENSSSSQPNPSFHYPYMQQIMNLRNTTSPYIPLNINSPFNSHNGNKFPTQSTPLGLSFNSSQVEFQHATTQYPHQTQSFSQSSVPIGQQNIQPRHMYIPNGNNSIGISETQPNNPPTSSSFVSNNETNGVEADTQSTYTSRIFPSSSRSAQISEMLDSYSLPNPDDLEQLFSSLENARNV